MNIKMHIPQDSTTLLYEKLKDESIERRLARWFINGEVGSSSKALAAWCMSIKPKWPMAPSDASDRMRCIKLLELIPEWQRYLDGIPFNDWEEQKELIKQEMVERGTWIDNAQEEHGQ